VFFVKISWPSESKKRSTKQDYWILFFNISGLLSVDKKKRKYISQDFCKMPFRSRINHFALEISMKF